MVATTLNRKASSPSTTLLHCKPLSISRLPRAIVIPSPCHKLLGRRSTDRQPGEQPCHSALLAEISPPFTGLRNRRHHFAASPPAELCVSKGKMLWKQQGSWQERDFLPSVPEYLLNIFVLCWRRKQIASVFSVLAASTCTRILLQDVYKTEDHS